MNRCLKITLLLFFFASIGFFASNIHAVMVDGETHPSFIGYVPNKIVVKFDQSISGQMNAFLMQQGRAGIAALDRLAVKYDVKSIIKQFPGAKRRMYRGRRIDLSGWHKIHFRKEVDVEKVVEAFKKLAGVIDAQPIGIHAVHRIPNDTFFPDQWHLNQTGGPDINAPEAWDFETGNEAIIAAVLDTGVRWFHKDLGGSNAVYFEPPGPGDTIDDLHGADGNMWINETELNGNPGEDDDVNTFDDDMIGWDFVNTSSRSCHPQDDCLTPDNDPRDFQGHGTHVAGIIAGMNNNAYANASPAGGWGDGTLQPSGNGVKIMALRIGYQRINGIGVVRMDYAAEAFRYAADNGARLANASWGSLNLGGFLGAAIDYFLAAGGLIFNSAGNDDNEIPDYMGTRDDIISVAATDTSDCKAWFSDFGDWIDISAPGTSIWSTYHNSTDPAGDYSAPLEGTSMASPMALSVAALIWSQNPTWTADQVKQKLFDTADAIDGLGCNSTYAGQLGEGRVNAFLAVGSCEGDFNGDGDVDGKDLLDLINEYDCNTGCSLDLTYDDAVNEADLDVFAKDFGRTSCPQGQ